MNYFFWGQVTLSDEMRQHHLKDAIKNIMVHSFDEKSYRIRSKMPRPSLGYVVALRELITIILGGAK